ncbi:MAG: PKD domain-containing protein [Patescibacteria group bacterium]|nr:PKD domain-containing protein [Patescibacteria group bacterium]
MKNINGKVNVFLGVAFMVMVMAVAAGAFPAYAHAGYYGSYDYDHSYVPTHGYYYSPTTYNPQPIVVNQPVYQPVYTQPIVYNYPVYNYPALTASCYPTSSSVQTGSSVQWVVNVSGGSGSYSYAWSGTDGLYGYGSSAYMTYYNAGYKTASVMITSGSQTTNVSCNSGVNVYAQQYYYNYPTYYNYSPALSVSCAPNTASSPVGTTVTWSANVTGGSGYYTYSWSGSDGLGAYGNSNSQSVSYTYTTPGSKIASVTIYSNGQTVTQSCSNTVNVGGSYVVSSGSNNNNSGLQIGCYSDPSNSTVNQPVTWNVEVTGGQAPYKYSWTGTDGLTGTNKSAIKYYSTSGNKSAIVTVTSADGLSGTQACSNSLTVSSGRTTAAPVRVTTQPTQPAAQNTSQTGAAFFSLEGVPWGWIAVLVIIILFSTVVYLLFNRPKI